MAGAFVATTVQPGLLVHEDVVMTALKLLPALNTCDRAIDAGFHRQIGYKVQAHANLIRGSAP
jgi:hypothetical protein